MKDTLLTLSSVLALGALGTGCLVDRGPLQGGGTDDDAGEVAADVTLPPDAHVDPGTDADLDAFSADAYADDAFSPDAYADDAYAPDACLVRCDGLDRVVCEGSSAEVRETCKLGCVDAPTPRCRRMITSNFGSSSVFDLGSSDLIIDAPTTINTDTMGEHVRQRDTSEVSRMVHGTIRISSTLTVIGSRPLVLIARDRIEVSGTIELSASGATPGPGGLAGGSTVGADATTPRAGRGGGHDGEYDDGGGGGGGLCGRGGDGGRGGGAGGGNGNGRTDLSTDSESLRGGGGGGAGNGRGGSFGAGGSGGGALQLSSRGAIDISGTIRARGSAGSGGRDSGGHRGAGGGGGAGGFVLIEAPSVTIGGTVDASGANGGGGNSGGGGGSGGGGTSSDATNGGDDTGSFGNGGGGGGGAGCIVVRAFDPFAPSMMLSPRDGVGLRTLPLLTD